MKPMSNTEKIATRHGDLTVEKKVWDKGLEVILNFHIDQECLFHWGLVRIPKGPWLLPPEEARPEKTQAYDNHAAQTPVPQGASLHIKLEASAYRELPFALYFPHRNEWDNNHGRNYRILFPEAKIDAGGSQEISDQELQAVAAEIIQKEMSGNSWTLMHRYNLCHHLVERVGTNQEGLSLLFVWLRFSALRQLDWQRNYNTKPRELSHAQQRLASRLARLYGGAPAQRDLVRLMLTTMGHGGEGQRIRDEILEIMHRHKIKEVSGIFMEQWHQKMHNNTTPDDIVICEAYLAFLRSNGDAETFYRILEAGGVTKERLETFERPITVVPEFYADKKEALIGDFEHFLGTLKSVHSATDLGTSILAARPHFDDPMHRLADFIWDHRDAAGAEATSLLEKATELRRLVITRLESNAVPPDLLFLDIAMEDFIRTVVERSMALEMGEETLLEWLSLAMENFLLAHKDEDLSLCLLHWNHIRRSRPLDRDLALQADGVLDRLERTIGDYAQAYQNLFQPKAQFLGKAFHAETWTIRLFGEEVMRGGLIFALSLLSHHLRQRLRRRAKLPSWQPISRGAGQGRVKVMDTLDGVQGRRFDPPAIIVSQTIRGDEDLPEGTLAVLTSASVDVVSHVAIRARNQGVLLATCYDSTTFEKIKSWKDRFAKIEIDTSGQVRLEPAQKSQDHVVTAGKHKRSVLDIHFAAPPDAPYAIGADDFIEGLVGGKSLYLKQVRSRLPDWIHLPLSVALPFGTFEKALKTEANRQTRDHYEKLLEQVDREPKVLMELHGAVMALAEPEGLRRSLEEAMEKTGLPLPGNAPKVWECIKRVWASKWNERAYWNRKSLGIPHENLLMAVLIQEVVPAQYAFIIHTVHPFSEDKDELYAEVVSGLGETLAGNYPGRALSCSCHKQRKETRLLTYPSKSTGLFGKGLIFRSDSNGEDLAGYAGAGLYSSFLVEPPQEVPVNYLDGPLVQDEAFREEFLSKICELGLLVEEALGSPQDIEGAYVHGRYYIVQTRPQVGLGA
jgi:alpha-glucan,water dikinase